MTRTIETLDALMARIVAEDARKFDVIADTRRMSVGFITDPPGRMDNASTSIRLDGKDGVQEFILTDHALGQVSTDLGIPKRYFDRMKVDAPDLFRSNVHHWLYNEPKARLVRGYTNDEGPMTGRAWMSDKFRRLDNMEIARTLLPEFENLGMPVEFHQAAVTDSRLYIRALFPTIEREISARQVGDIVRWGVEIKNSEIGAGSLAISGFVLRLACTNGMVATKALSARHVGKREDEGILSNEALAADDVAFWLAARDTLRATCTEATFEQVVARLDESASSTPVISPVAATKVLASEFSLTDDEQEAVMLSLVSQGDLTRWGALNAVTAVAKTSESFDRQAEMEGIGWEIAQMTAPAWERVALAVK
jgi:hypothetical protein